MHGAVAPAPNPACTCHLNSQASVIDMLRGVIIQSGNDASKALAEHMAGNEPAFAELMNKESARLGMKGYPLHERHWPARS
jgi:D-alanyl-D-alanine carboxypeptidase